MVVDADVAAERCLRAVAEQAPCARCGAAPVNVALVPCGHCLWCDACGAGEPPARCPECGEPVRDACAVLENGRPPLRVPPLAEQARGPAPEGGPLPGARAFVIHLARREDRAADVAALCASLAPHAPAAPFDATDGHAPGGVPGFSAYPGWRLEGAELEAAAEAAGGLLGADYARGVKPGEVGCAASHVRVWREAAASGLRYALVLEDDACLFAGAWAELRAELAALEATGRAWDILYLGRQRAPGALGADGPRRATPRLVEPGFSFCTHAYVLSASGACKLAGLSDALAAAVVPLDDLLPALFSRHPRPDVRRMAANLPRLDALAWCDDERRHAVDAWGDADGLVWQRLNPGSDTRRA